NFLSAGVSYLLGSGLGSKIMEFAHAIGDILECLGFFGGISLIVLASSKAKIDKMKAERQLWQQPAQQNDTAVLAELKAMKQQISEMQSTGHQFDISFDAALNRLEERVSRVETKVAVPPAVSVPTEQYQRNGQG
ncbi:MAG: hypothetical protein ACRYFS_14100, partial [Janthinobacterium lividum]